VAFTSEDRVRDVIRNFDADGFGSLYPKYRGGRPPKFTLGQRREIKKIAKSRPAELDLPFSAWSLSKLAEFLVAEGWSTTSATRACGSCSARRGVTFQCIKTWKTSEDPHYAPAFARSANSTGRLHSPSSTNRYPPLASRTRRREGWSRSQALRAPPCPGRCRARAGVGLSRPPRS
jgi:transposase